jgi:gamma-glutamyl:cysteine ligase YbdK (ATP-grasp superfamily)
LGLPLPSARHGVDTTVVDERLRAWRPTQEEVDEIVRSLRPLLRELAFREQEKIAAEILRRRRAARCCTQLPPVA